MIHIQVEISLPHCSDGREIEENIAIPANDAWLAAMRSSVHNAAMLMLRLNNYPVDGSTGKVALTIGPTDIAEGVPGEEDDYLDFGCGANAPTLFGFLLDRYKLDELIAALQIMQAHFPAPCRTYPSTQETLPISNQANIAKDSSNAH